MMVCIMSPPSAAAASGGGDGVFDVCLYQCIGGVITNINKLMVAEKYACDEDKIGEFVSIVCYLGGLGACIFLGVTLSCVLRHDYVGLLAVLLIGLSLSLAL